MLSLATQTDRTLFFDLLPLELREIRGIKIRLQVYTVPGQVFYNETRKLVLKNTDAIVMVLDSQKAMREKNIESLNNLFENLRELGISIDSIPMVLQFNKRDLRDIMAIDEMDRLYNTHKWPRVEAAAIKGEGVLQTLKVATKLLYSYLTKKHFKTPEEGGELRFKDEAGAPVRMARPTPIRPSEEAPPESAPPEHPRVSEPAVVSLPSESLAAIDKLIKENLAVFNEHLDIPFFQTAQGLFNDLNMAIGKLFEETARMREDIIGLRRTIENFSEEIQAMKAAAQQPETRSLISSLFQRK